MSSKRNQNGFGFIEAIVIIAILAILGFLGWRLYESQTQPEPVQSNNQSSSNPDANQDDTEGGTPVGWTEYSNKSYSFSFAYPEEWGEVMVNEASTSHEGGHYFLTFSNYDHYKIGMQTYDYKYTSRGRGMPFVNGFTDYSKEYQDILKHEDGTEGYDGEIVKKTDNYIVYTTFELVDGNALAKGIAKTEEVPGLEFAYYIPFSELNVTNDELLKIQQGEGNARKYISQDNIDTVVTFAENIKSF